MSSNNSLPKGSSTANQLDREPETPFLEGELLAEIERETAETWASGLVGYQLESPFQSAFEAGLETLLEAEADLVEEGFFDEALDEGEWEASPAALELEGPFQDEVELEQASFIEPEAPEREFARAGEKSLDEAFPAYLDEQEEEGLFLDAEAYYSEEGLLLPGAESDLEVDAWEAAAPGRQLQTSELAESEIARLDEEMEQIAAELENISTQLISQDEPQEEGQLGFIFSRFGNLFSLGPPSAAADPSVAVPPFSFLKRLLMPVSVLDAAQSANAIRWNQRQHPRASGVDPNDIRTDLQRYVSLSAVQGAISAFNRANPSAQIAMGTPPIDAVFVEAVHQFQAKCFFEAGQIDGLAGESTLDSLGLVVRSGMNAADRPNAGAVRRLRRVNVSGETGGEFTANSWFDSMVNPSFLGWRFTTGGTVRGVHLYFMRKLRIAEKALLAQPKFRGLTPVELGKALGFSARSEEHKGARPTATSASMHTYGLSVDIMYSGNPWVRGAAFTDALKRAALLISGLRITQTTSQQFFHSLGSDPNLTTAQIFDILSQRDQDFRQYLRLHNDPAELRNRLNQRRAAGTPGVFASSSETMDQAVLRWQGDIQVDRVNMQAKNSPFRTDSRSLRDPHRGFLNLNKDLVVALRDKACLAWGAVDIGPDSDGSGDIMHFDARVCGLGDQLASVGGNFRVTSGHPCRPCGSGGSSSTDLTPEVEVAEEFYHDPAHSMQEEPSVSEATWSEVEYEQDGELEEAAYLEREWAPAEEAFLGTASFLPEWLTEAVKGGLLSLQAAWAMLSGQRDVNTLTNMVFYARNPHLPVGYKIQPHEKGLIQQWLRIRDEVIKPLLRRLEAGVPAGPAAPPSTASAPSGLPPLAPLLDRIRAAPKTYIEPRTRRVVVDGYERAEPRGDVWCQQAGLTLDEGALARMVASEVGTKPPQYMLAVVEATMNEARAKRISAFQRITMQGLKLRGGVTPKSAGYFGRQSGRWCASIQDPTLQHLEAVRIALASPEPLVARDGRRWVDGKVMDGGRQAGKKLKNNAVTIVEKWGAEGWEWIGPVYGPDGRTPLLDPYRLMIFRRAGRGKADIRRGVEAMREGRRRWKVKVD